MTPSILEQLKTNERAYAFWPEDMKAAWEEVPLEYKRYLSSDPKDEWLRVPRTQADHRHCAVYRVSPAYNPPAAKTGIVWRRIGVAGGDLYYTDNGATKELVAAPGDSRFIGYRSNKYDRVWTGSPVIYRLVDRTTGVSAWKTVVTQEELNSGEVEIVRATHVGFLEDQHG